MFLDAGGHRLEYVLLEPDVTQARTRPTLVFLHEGLGSVAMWKAFPAQMVAATGCPALVYSRYGHGQSDKLAAARQVDYMHREAIEILPEVLDRLGIAAPILIGHSDGASIALIHAGAVARPVRGLVAMAPHVFVEDVTVASIAQARVSFQTTDLPARLGRYHDDAVSMFAGWNDIWLHQDFRSWNIESFLRYIGAPVLVIQGEDDQYGTAAQVDAIARQVAGRVETLMLPDCAHSPHLSSNKDAVIAAIAAFVATLPPPP